MGDQSVNCKRRSTRLTILCEQGSDVRLPKQRFGAPIPDFIPWWILFATLRACCEMAHAALRYTGCSMFTDSVAVDHLFVPVL